MALTKTAPNHRVVAIPPAERRLLWHPAVLVVAALILLGAFGWAFLQDTSLTAPTRDPAWYTWRANVILEGDPGRLAQEWGPDGVFAGGYRVTVPLAGALLQRVAGVDQFTFSAFMMIGFPVLTGLALGAFAYRHHRDPLLFLVVLLATAGLFLTTPYVGYLDNITILYVLSLLLAFIGPARTSWGARSAVFLFGVVGAFTHPTTCVFFGASLMAAFGVSFLTSRFSLAAPLQRYGPGLLSAGSGMIFGLALWVAGIWGPAGSLKDAAVPPPYTKEFFLNRLGGWITSLQPIITFPLIGLGIAWIILRSRSRREPADVFGAISIAWLLPLLGIFGFLFIAEPYPYYRFVNATAAVMALTGLGAWVAIRWLLRGEGSRQVAGVVASVALVGALGYVPVDGLQHRWAGSDTQWADQDTRVALASVREVVKREGAGHPVVFVANYRDDPVAYGWAKTFTNVGRNGLPGDAAGRAATYFGTVENFLAGEPTEGKNPEYTKVSRDYLAHMNHKVAQYPEPPMAFLVERFYQGVEPGEADAALASGIALGEHVSVIDGPGLATPSPAAVEAARAVGERQAAALADPPSPLANPLHTLRVLAGLFLLVVLPGLLASRWFELEDGWTKVALIPGLSIGLVLVSAIAVLAVARGPLGAGSAWAAVGVATAGAAGLALGRRRLLAVLGRFSGFFEGMFAAFSNRSFSALMGTQFLAQAADGIVQASLAKAITFQNEEGFDITSAPSTRYVLLVVLALYVPYTIVSPFAGAFIDRYDRRELLIRSNLFRGAVIAAVAVALSVLGDGLPDVFLIGAILVALACTRMLLAIKSAGLPSVLRGKDLLQGNGLSQAGGAIFQVVGGGIALVGTSIAPAGLVALGGAGVYVIAAVVARRVDHLETARRTARFSQEVRRVFADIAAGLREIARRPAARLGLTSFQALRMEFFGFVALVFALQARTLLSGEDSDTTVVAIAGAFGAIGAAAGMVAAQKLKDRIPPVRLLLAAMTAMGVGVIAFGGITTIVGFSAITFIGALGFFLGKISADTIMQQALPDDFRGRGFSLFDIAYNLGWIVPALVLSIVWSGDRVRLILIASGVVFLAVTALIAVWARSISDQFAPTDDVTGTVPG